MAVNAEVRKCGWKNSDERLNQRNITLSSLTLHNLTWPWIAERLSMGNWQPRSMRCKQSKRKESEMKNVTLVSPFQDHPILIDSSILRIIERIE
jgi:hypothetical protein